MDRLEEIKASLKWGEEVEGKEYAHKALSLEDILWLIKRIEKLEEERNELFKDRNMWIEGSEQQQKEIESLSSTLKESNTYYVEIDKKIEEIRVTSDLLIFQRDLKIRELKENNKRLWKTLIDIANTSKDYQEDWAEVAKMLIDLATDALEVI